ncbi:MAG TPA: tetratricopeptide repeat protein [Tepidisphaeraceae bacterium]|jgi:predicted O-linked N-acetylglucosamine transferase (SPINDLY family)
MSADEQLLVQAGRDLAAGRVAAAESAALAVLTRQPRNPKAMDFLAGVALARGRLDEGVQWLQKAVALDPHRWELHYNLGLIHATAGRNGQAIAAYEQALRLRPQTTQAHNNLGNIFQAQGRLSEAAHHFEAALRQDPKYFPTHNNYGLVLLAQGKIDEALVSLRKALALEPRYYQVHSNILLSTNSHEAFSREAQLQEHQRYGLQQADVFGAARPPLRQRPAGDRLRIGYLSADFRSHSVAFFLARVLESHDRSRFSITCYANVTRPDAMTQRMRGRVDQWRDIVRLSDDQVAHLIRQDGIDVLVELGGHTDQNRLLVLARRAAPVQVSYLGYPNTTGMSQVDYLITDSHIAPEGADRYYVEKLARVSGSFFCYFGPDLGIPIAPPPVVSKGFVTFGVLTNWVKVRPMMMERWAEILRRIPNSRLILKANSLRDMELARATKEFFIHQGIDGERIETQGWVEFLAYMELMSQIDIGLDTFPFNGHTTTCHQLWMGVPVVTLVGQTHSSRMGLSVMQGIGLPELVAESPEQYVETAVALAGDVQRLQDLRATMRDRWNSSGLLDGKRMATELERIYGQIWKSAAESSR